MIYRSRGDEVYLYSALGSFRDGFIAYEVQRAYHGKDVDMNLFDFEKIDSFDANLDGCADYAHFGVVGGVKIGTYKLSVCSADIE